MEKHGETRGQGSYLRSVLYGLLGAALFLGLLLLAAAVSGTQGKVMELKSIIAKGCLLLGALLSGILAGRRAGQGRLQRALAAEGVLLAVLMLCVLAIGAELRPKSICVDLLLVLIGAFAGTFLKRKQSVKRRGKR